MSSPGDAMSPAPIQISNYILIVKMAAGIILKTQKSDVYLILESFDQASVVKKLSYVDFKKQVTNCLPDI